LLNLLNDVSILLDLGCSFPPHPSMLAFVTVEMKRWMMSPDPVARSVLLAL